MKVEQWLEMKGLTASELAREIKASVSSITRLIPAPNKKQIRRPGRQLMKKLHVATQGAITAADYEDAPSHNASTPGIPSL